MLWRDMEDRLLSVWSSCFRLQNPQNWNCRWAITGMVYARSMVQNSNQQSLKEKTMALYQKTGMWMQMHCFK